MPLRFNKTPEDALPNYYVRPELLPVLSLDTPIHPGESDGFCIGDMLSDPSPNPEEQLMNKEARQRIAAAFRVMRPNERKAVVLHAQGYTLEEIGTRMGVCRERVRQWERDGRLAASGEPRYQMTPEYKAAEEKRRRQARAKYAADEQLRRKEIERNRRARRRERRSGDE